MVTYILAWLLVNTWASLLIAKLVKFTVEDWKDLLELAVFAIISPWPFIIYSIFKSLFCTRY